MLAVLLVILPPVVKGIVLLQCQLCVSKGIFIIFHRQINPRQHGVSRPQRGVEHRLGFFRQIRQRLCQIRQDKLIHSGNSHLLGRRSHVRGGNQGHGQFLVSRGSIVSIGIIIQQVEIIHGAEHFCLRYQFLPLFLGAFRGVGHVANHQVPIENIAVGIIISPLVAVILPDTVLILHPIVINHVQRQGVQCICRDIKIVHQIHRLREVATMVVIVADKRLVIGKRGRYFLPGCRGSRCRKRTTGLPATT